jgi:FkbM family methyltransferase
VTAREYPAAFLHELASSWFNDFVDNHDAENLGDDEPPPPVSGEYLYGLLADQPSRDLLVKLMAYRLLGHRKVKLPRNTLQYWDAIRSMAELRTADEPMRIKFKDETLLAAYDLRPLGYAITCHSSTVGLACNFIQKQYEYHRDDVHCKVEPTDIVIDAGACWGETTLNFAHNAGPLGMVVAHEFTPSNLVVFHRNMELNPRLKDHIYLAEAAVWKKTGQLLNYVDWGPGSRVTEDERRYASYAGLAETITIDDTAARFELARVNFIKMDIEGAELEALRGGEATIRKHRPKLAISLYHNPQDVETIPRYLAGLDLGYRFYLDHHTIYSNETVLFGVP